MSQESRRSVPPIEPGTLPCGDARGKRLQLEPLIPSEHIEIAAPAPDACLVPPPAAGGRGATPALVFATHIDMAATQPRARARWHQLDAAIPPSTDFAYTYARTGPAYTATHSGARWISPALRHSVEFPHIWVRSQREQRHLTSRSRVRNLIQRLCGLDPVHPPPRTAIVVAHPDDEAIGAGARLSTVPDSTIIHVTDGAPRDHAYAVSKGFPNRQAYARSRQDELTAALAVLGFPRERTRCLEIVDGEAADNLVEITYRLASLFDELRPEVAVTHPYEGGHTDHDATAFAVHLACGVLRREGAVAPVILELTSYHLYAGARRVGAFLPFGDLEERTVELDNTTQKVKQAAYDCFTSQRRCLASFPRDREKFRAAPRYVFTRPPHTGPLLYERMSRSLAGERWRENATQALQRLRSPNRLARAS